MRIASDCAAGVFGTRVSPGRLKYRPRRSCTARPLRRARRAVACEQAVCVCQRGKPLAIRSALPHTAPARQRIQPCFGSPVTTNGFPSAWAASARKCIARKSCSAFSATKATSKLDSRIDFERRCSHYATGCFRRRSRVGRNPGRIWTVGHRGRLRGLSSSPTRSWPGRTRSWRNDRANRCQARTAVARTSLFGPAETLG